MFPALLQDLYCLKTVFPFQDLISVSENLAEDRPVDLHIVYD